MLKTPSLRLLVPLGLSALVLVSTLAPSWAQSASKPAIPAKPATTPLSTEAKVKLEFAAWRYQGAQIGASFQRGPISLLSITTTDNMEKVWKFYLSRVPTETKVPLAYSWDIPGDNTMIGANYTLGSSYAVTLNSAPREAGTIVYQKGTENVVIEIRARTPEQIKETGVQTDIKLIKMKPLGGPKTAPAAGEKPVQEAPNPATTW